MDERKKMLLDDTSPTHTVREKMISSKLGRTSQIVEKTSSKMKSKNT
jgi:hypothetical protein